MDLSSSSTRGAPQVTRALLLATALVAGSECVAPTEATESAWIISVEKSGSSSASEEWFPEPMVLVEANRLQISGWLRTPYICDDVSPIVFATASRISIRLVQTRRSDGCVMAVGEHTYLVAGTLRPGTYDLEVVVDSRIHMPVSTAPFNARVRID